MLVGARSRSLVSVAGRALASRDWSYRESPRWPPSRRGRESPRWPPSRRGSARASSSESPAEKMVVVGVETSCDDTGVAVMTGAGQLLGNCLLSQTQVHKTTGGIVPIVAADLHRDHLQRVTDAALRESGLHLEEVSVVAVTVGPGLALCLQAGLEFVKSLAKIHRKPVVPVHHMAAHALMPRWEQEIPFPYLVLLVSGGHCILAIAHSSDRFSRLGQTRDDSPGEALDKLARWLGLDNHPEVGEKVGGAAVEFLAQRGDPTRFPFPPIMVQRKCCSFSFSGLKTSAHTLIARIAMEEGWKGGSPLPGCEDMCASFQEALCRHLLTRTHRALLYTRQHFPEVKHFVLSGGVASNEYLRTKLRPLLHHYDITLHCPPPHLCTDNGVMIAWAAMESMRSGQEPTLDLDSLDFIPKWPLGDDISTHVQEILAHQKLPKIPDL